MLAASDIGLRGEGRDNLLNCQFARQETAFSRIEPDIIERAGNRRTGRGVDN